MKCFKSNSYGISSAAPICRQIASTKPLKFLFGLPGFISCAFSPSARSSIAPGPSSRLFSSSSSIRSSSAMPDPTGSPSSFDSFSIKTVKSPDITAAINSASVYRPNCFNASMTGARKGTPRRWSILSRHIKCSTFFLPVFSPYAVTLCHSMRSFAYDNGWCFEK